MKKTVRFALERHTKGALRYVEVDAKNEPITTDVAGRVVGALYLRKAAYPDPPDVISITIENASSRRLRVAS